MPQRLYRVVWKNDRTRKRGVMANGPLTHREAVTVLSKIPVHTRGPARYVRFLVEEIPSRSHRIEGRGIDDDAGPRGTGPKRSMSFGVMPPRKEFRRHFDYYVGKGGRYRIGNDRFLGTTTLSEPELFALVKRFGSMLGSRRKDSEEKASLASAIMETLGFEWI